MDNIQRPSVPLSTERHNYLKLFLVGLLSLFFELAALRWFSAYVSFLHYFANVAWIACFIGLGIGALCSTSKTQWLPRFPGLSLMAYILGVLVFLTLTQRWGFSTDIGVRDGAQSVFFGLEKEAKDLAKFAVPIEVVVTLVFIMLALMSVGFGQVLGRALSGCERRIAGYVWNIAGSLAGILLFIAASFFQLPAVTWFALIAFLTALLLRSERSLSKEHLVYLVLGAGLIGALDLPWSKDTVLRWSPYYMVGHSLKDQAINVDNIGHQTMQSLEEYGAGYSLIHLLNRDSGGKPFQDVLVIGAGSGNDVSHAIYQKARLIDAVEIDPVIADIGRKYHPDKPYSGAAHGTSVNLHITDGRAFLQRAPSKRYDLVVYALVDSLLSSSSFSGVRLESFLFTKEALQEVRRVLKDDGIFVTYNVFRQGWIIQHLVNLVKASFGTDALVLSIPHSDVINPDDHLSHLTIVAAGNIAPMLQSFSLHGSFELMDNVREASLFNGFEKTQAARGGRQKLKPVEVRSSEMTAVPSDNWPQLYLKNPSIPFRPYISLLALLAAATAIVFVVLLPQNSTLQRAQPRMFFLGAGFLLLETRAVIQLQLLFGSTWLVTSFVFAAILLLALLANSAASLTERLNLTIIYSLLFAALIVVWALPYHWFMQQQNWLLSALAVVLTLLPVPLGSLIFADTLRKSAAPDSDVAANFLGSCAGGALEILSLMVGIRGLAVVALLIYAFSIYTKPRSPGIIAVGAE